MRERSLSCGALHNVVLHERSLDFCDNQSIGVDVAKAATASHTSGQMVWNELITSYFAFSIAGGLTAVGSHDSLKAVVISESEFALLAQSKRTETSRKCES